MGGAAEEKDDAVRLRALFGGEGECGICALGGVSMSCGKWEVKRSRRGSVRSYADRIFDRRCCLAAVSTKRIVQRTTIGS
jgi:hypothetical protein